MSEGEQKNAKFWEKEKNPYIKNALQIIPKSSTNRQTNGRLKILEKKEKALHYRKILVNSSKIISNTLLYLAISPDIFNYLIKTGSTFHLLLIK